MLTVSGLHVPISVEDDALQAVIAEKLRISREEIRSYRILRKSIDARKKQDIYFNEQVAVSLTTDLERRLILRGDHSVAPYHQTAKTDLPTGTEPVRGRIIVVGLGPAGLFAAYRLAEYGFRPLVIERGRPIGERTVDVNTFWQSGLLDENSNVMFGEGGAGTFSDGKLTTRIKDPRAEHVLDVFIEHGAPEEIRYLAKPHIGTDRLRGIVSELRKRIEALGGEVRFSSCLVGLEQADGTLTAARIRSERGEETVPCSALVLAIGQGARDTYRMLLNRGVQMQPKPFAIGVRVEHPQTLVDRSQYGAYAGDPRLGAAEYRLTARSGDRGVYTFCMCPGGYVVASSSGRGQVVVNGMSNYARDGENANAAIVVQVGQQDFGTDPLAGVRYCEKLERDAFLAGGGDYCAPASRIADFLAHGKPHAFGSVKPTYRPGVRAVDLWECLPEPIARGIANGILDFAEHLRGFDLQDGVLTAVESRTSAPVRINRTEEGESVSLCGLYPVGEGAGYAGGIVSAAVDGLRAAEKLIAKYRAPGV